MCDIVFLIIFVVSTEFILYSCLRSLIYTVKVERLARIGFNDYREPKSEKKRPKIQFMLHIHLLNNFKLY